MGRKPAAQRASPRDAAARAEAALPQARPLDRRGGARAHERRGVIDTHAHLGDDADEVLERARTAGVTRVIDVATSVEGARTTLARADRSDDVYACLGIHPHEAGKPAELDELRTLLEHPKAVAVGETGLDYFRDYASHDDQQRLFDAELELARELA